MLNSISDIKKFINDKSFKKILILCGKKSFKNSGAETLLKQSICNKNLNYFKKFRNTNFWWTNRNYQYYSKL